MLTCTIKNGIGLVTINRPEKLNAINKDMFFELEHALRTWESDSSVHMVLVRSTVPKAFSAGGDLRMIHELKKTYSEKEAEDSFAQFFKREYDLNAFIRSYKKPYVSLMHGIAMGGGLGISIHGGYRIVSEDITMAMPECAIGFFPDIISSAFLKECPGEIGTFLGVTGYRMNAADALYTGLATHYMSKATQEVFLETLFQAPIEGSAAEVLYTLLDHFSGEELPMASELEKNRDLIDQAFSNPTLEEAIETLTLSKNRWTWPTLDAMEESSPLSLKVAFTLLKAARYKSFEELHALDLSLSQFLIHEGDFLEGIRAKIIDKDGNPQWKHENLGEVCFDLPKT